ncbi:MAG: 23S rRNA (guanosine(2251)-2'-O)-methyltransferase RlmB [Hydrotalea sp.]|nr:23S rRNA (guanosine(2251)-2'-O)-methyltransferase RlmB [Hydrotalea sp.]
MSRKLARESSRGNSGARFNNRSDSGPRRFGNRSEGRPEGRSESRFGDRPRPSYGAPRGDGERSFGSRGDSRGDSRGGDGGGFRSRPDGDRGGFRPRRDDGEQRGGEGGGERRFDDRNSGDSRPPRREGGSRFGGGGSRFGGGGGRFGGGGSRFGGGGSRFGGGGGRDGGRGFDRDNRDGGRPPRFSDRGDRGEGRGDRGEGRGFSRGPSRGFSDDRGDRGNSRLSFRKSFDRDRPNDRRDDQYDDRRGSGQRSRLPKNDGYYLYGFHAVVAALLNPAREKIKLHLTVEAKEKLEKNETIKKLLAEMGLAVDVMDRHGIDHQFADVLHDAPHQGVVFETRPLPHVDLRHHLESIIMVDKKESPCCFLILDKLQDPHNIGAILRSARYFNIDGVVLPERHTAPESAVMAKSASGALEVTPLIRVSNLSEAIKLFKKHGFWVYGLNQHGTQPLEKTNFDKKSVIVMGQEGGGVSPLVNSQTDFSVKIDGAMMDDNMVENNVATDAPTAEGADSSETGGEKSEKQEFAVNNVDSLNVSNATAVALYQWSITKGL